MLFKKVGSDWIRKARNVPRFLFCFAVASVVGLALHKLTQRPTTASKTIGNAKEKAIALKSMLNFYEMKIISLFLILLLIFKQGYAQTYEYGALFSLGTFVKTDGKIVITDTSVVISAGDLSNVYRLVKKVNNIIYFTDGVMTHFFAFTSETGKKKGFNYDTLIVWSLDKRQSDVSVMYYAKKE